MYNFISLILTLSFILLTATSFAQIETDDDLEWDYCECIEGIQAITDVCPCQQTFPPIPSGNGSGPTIDPPIDEPSGGLTLRDLLEMYLGDWFCVVFPSLC